MKYIQFVNNLLKETTAKTDTLVMYGQNISTGSCLSGLTRGLLEDEKHLILNTPNIENTLVGVGFGLMINKISSIFFMKQQDFLLLGIDHLVNTYNYVRLNEPEASFSIVTLVVDNGYQGIQSSLNNLSDYCSIARVPGYTVTNKHDAAIIIGKKMIEPGFRIIGVSQESFAKEIHSYSKGVELYDSGNLFKYKQGVDFTIVCFNFSFNEGVKLEKELTNKGYKSSIFTVNNTSSKSWGYIADDVKKTGKLIILDDSKSVNRTCYQLENFILKKCDSARTLIFKKECNDKMLRPNSDEFQVDCDIIQSLIP